MSQVVLEQQTTEKLPELPRGWCWTKVGESIKKVSLTGKKLKERDYQDQGKLPVIDQGQSFIGGYTDNEELKVSCELPVIVFGDHTKIVKFIDFDFVAGADGVKVIKPMRVFYPKLFYYFLQAIQLPEKGYARHFQFLETSMIPLPPLPEQRRIVAKIEELFTKLDAGVEALKRVKVLLKHYRAAVLKAACEGKLVPTEAGTWKEATIQQLGEVKGGKRLPAGHTYSEQPTKFPYIRVVDFVNGTVALGNLKYLTAETQAAISRYTISKANVYISIAGTIGLVGIIPEVLDGANLTENAAKICNLSGVIPKYLCCYLASPAGQLQIAGQTIATTQAKLALFRIEKIVVPLPPLAEQERIVAEVERRLSVVEQLEEMVAANLKRAERLRQSILKKAFEGKLVPQDPTDEPASLLLERIKIEKVKREAEKKASKGPKSNMKKKQMRLIDNAE